MKRLLCLGLSILLLSSCQGRELAISSTEDESQSLVSAHANLVKASSDNQEPSTSSGSEPPVSSSQVESSSSDASAVASSVQQASNYLPELTIQVLDQEGLPVINRQLWLSFEGKLLQRDFLDSYGQQIYNSDGTAREGTYSFSIHGADDTEDTVSLFLSREKLLKDKIVTLRMAERYPEKKNNGNLTITLVSQQTGEPIQNVWAEMSNYNQNFYGNFLWYSTAEGKLYGTINRAGEYALSINNNHRNTDSRQNIVLAFDVDTVSDDMEITLEVDTDLMENWK